MLASQRQQRILDSVLRQGSVRISELSRELRVSDMTVRRDVEVLARDGLVDKVHGGATARASSAGEPGFEAKRAERQAEKRAIARAAARLVEPGSAVGISAGTTTWTLAHELREVPGLTVVTNSIQVASVFHAGVGDQTVILTGGVRTPSDALVGPLAVAALRQLHVDVVVMGAHGIDVDRGLMTPNLLEADTDRALVRAGRRLVVVADSTKWGTLGLAAYASLDQCDAVVTDAGIEDRVRGEVAERVGELLVVEAA